MIDFATHACNLTGRHLTAHEAARIYILHDNDIARFAALRSLVAPRIEYEWRQAGGPSHREFTDEQIEQARKFHQRLKLPKHSLLALT